jgi:hypothetical protein
LADYLVRDKAIAGDGAGRLGDRESRTRSTCFALSRLPFYFFPKVIGLLLGLAGVCYFINSFVIFMPKGFGDELFPWILLPVLLGEGALALWLLIVGVNSSRWTMIAASKRSAS